MSSLMFSIKSYLQVGRAGGSPKLAVSWVQRPGPQAQSQVHIHGTEQGLSPLSIFCAGQRGESTKIRKGRQKQGLGFMKKTRVVPGSRVTGIITWKHHSNLTSPRI